MAKRKKKAKAKSTPKKKPVKKAASKKVVSKKAPVKKVEPKKPKVEEDVSTLMDAAEERINVIGKNGNDGEHYEKLKPVEAPEPVKKVKERDLPTEVKEEWVALFSGSGKEIVDTVERLGFWPGMIITNNHLTSSWDEDLVKREAAVTDKKKKNVRTVNVTQSKTANFIHRYARCKESKVTLHNWNKDIPDTITSAYDIVEGAPTFAVVSIPSNDININELETTPPVTTPPVTAPVVDLTPVARQSPIGESPAKSKRWIAMFSQSGSEIANLAEALGYWPDVIVTNNSDKSKWDERVLKRNKQGEHTDLFKVVVVTSEQAKTANFLHKIEGSKNALVTLHGWLRIIPAEICSIYKIVNGHPSLINQYPELKGKDPQLRWWADRDKYDKWYGSVVHDVVAEVDAGQIHAVNKRQLTSYEEMDCNPFDLFRQTSLNSWLKYFVKFPIR